MIIKLDFLGNYDKYEYDFHDIIECRVNDIRSISTSLLAGTDLYYRPSIDYVEYVYIDIPDKTYDKYKIYINELLEDMMNELTIMSDVNLYKYRRSFNDFSN